MLEIEVKFRVADFNLIEQKLADWNARFIEQRDDADSYWNAPHRDFAKTDEALRVRQIGTRNFVTYKGPRIDHQTKTRIEIEVPLADGASSGQGMQEILAALGFRPTAIVNKNRRVYEFQRAGFEIQVCLDTAAEIGTFVELEIVADESKLESARTVVLHCAAELGLTDQERRSYLELLLQKRGLA